MKKCLNLAKLGLNKTQTNPLVGCVIVHNEKIVASGYHEKYGGPHAERNAINNLKEKHPNKYKSILSNSTIYINLEPCSHFGKTPPCTDLILKYQIPNVVIGTLDPYKEVNGLGIKKLNKATKVIVGVNKELCLELNKKYFINQKFQRPWILLKWAESQDGFINTKSKGSTQISGKDSVKLCHKWRSEIDAIMVGTNTVLNDNPYLTTRHFIGKNPIRITIDRKNILEQKLFNIMNKDSKTIILQEKDGYLNNNINYLDYRSEENTNIETDQEKIASIMKLLYKKGISSIMVEGGKTILNNLINQGLWDEARVIVSEKKLYNGIEGPEFLFKKRKVQIKNIGKDKLYFIKNNNNLFI